MSNKNINFMAFLIMIAALVFVIQPVSAQTITDLGTLPGGVYSRAHGINNLGQVVGESGTASSDTHAFLWTPQGGMIDIGILPGGIHSIAYGINELEQVVGEGEGGANHAFLWTQQGGMTDLGTLPGLAFSHAYDINNLGQVVGDSETHQFPMHTFLWTQQGGMTDLGNLPGGTTSGATGINNLGQVVGSSFVSDGWHVFLWTQQGGMTDLGTLPGATSSYEHGINDLGQVVGESGGHAFLWEKGVMKDLGTLPGGTSSIAYGINNLGQVVGESGGHAFLWTQQGGMTDLGTLPGGGSSGAYGINDLGQVVGYSDNRATLWTVSIPILMTSVQSSTGKGHVSFKTSSGTIQNLAAVDPSTIPPPPAGINLYYGLFSFDIMGIIPGNSVTLTLTFPNNLPEGTTYWKYQTSRTPAWYPITPEIINGNEMTLTLTDGGVGDSDNLANGIIHDPGGPSLTGSISGIKFEDINANGKFDNGESLLSNWTITLTNDTSVMITQTTAPDGSYKFTNLTDGNYSVGEVIQPGWIQTIPATVNHTVTITSGVNIIGQDFGNFKKGNITGGGWIKITGDPKATFGIVGQYPDSSNIAKGNVEYQDHIAKLNIKSIKINTVATTMDKKIGVITGTAQMNGAGTYPFEVYFEDNAEPGKGADVFKISLPTYPYSNGAVLNSGNIQIHN